MRYQDAYKAGSDAALKSVGVPPAPAKPPAPDPFKSVGVPAAALKNPFTPPKPPTTTTVPGAPSAQVAQATLEMPKSAGFSMSHRPEERALEATRADAHVRQPATNQQRHMAGGIQPAFASMQTPTESDPYTVPRMF